MIPPTKNELQVLNRSDNWYLAIQNYETMNIHLKATSLKKALILSPHLYLKKLLEKKVLRGLSLKSGINVSRSPLFVPHWSAIKMTTLYQKHFTNSISAQRSYSVLFETKIFISNSFPERSLK